jgi:hypothetical protein
MIRPSAICARMVRVLAFRAFFPVFCAIALTASVAACKPDNLTWKLDGTVIRGNERLATKLQSVTTALVADGGVYLGGYQIDAANVNHPHIVFVPSDLKTERYWARQDSIQSFFPLKGRINVLESSGKAFERRDDDWIPSNLRFKPRSVVIDTDTLIACNPGPLLMTSTERGSCYSPTAGWSVDINWRGVKPAICSGKLTAVEVRQGTMWARQIRSTDGIELAVRKLTIPPSDACSVEFDTAKQ